LLLLLILILLLLLFSDLMLADFQKRQGTLLLPAPVAHVRHLGIVPTKPGTRCVMCCATARGSHWWRTKLLLLLLLLLLLGRLMEKGRCWRGQGGGRKVKREGEGG
jgi:hypothetical protein